MAIRYTRVVCVMIMLVSALTWQVRARQSDSWAKEIGKTPQQVRDDFKAFVVKVRAALPDTRIAYIGIKPSIQRWALIGRIREANALVREYCAGDDHLGFIDVDGPMLGWDEKPRKDLFAADGLHLSPKGYALWTTLVQPFLDERQP